MLYIENYARPEKIVKKNLKSIQVVLNNGDIKNCKILPNKSKSLFDLDQNSTEIFEWEILNCICTYEFDGSIAFENDMIHFENPIKVRDIKFDPGSYLVKMVRPFLMEEDYKILTVYEHRYNDDSLMGEMGGAFLCDQNDTLIFSIRKLSI